MTAATCGDQWHPRGATLVVAGAVGWCPVRGVRATRPPPLSSSRRQGWVAWTSSVANGALGMGTEDAIGEGKKVEEEELRRGTRTVAALRWR